MKIQISKLLYVFLLSSPTVIADITGTVFRDYNANGVKDNASSLNEVGLAGVTITAYDAAGTNVGTATSAADGTYTIAGANGALRVELTGLPADDYPSKANRTNVQFVTAPTTGVDFAVNNPYHYTQSTPNVAVTMQVVGPYNELAVDGSDFKSRGAVIQYPMGASGKTGNTDRATHAQIGATHGMAYQRSTGDLFVSAFTRRGTGYGPQGIGAIYKISNTNTVSHFATIPNTGTDPHSLTGGDYRLANYDQNTIASTGKTSLGDLDLSPDGQTLYVVNLYDRHLYSVAVTNGAVNDLGLITSPNTCNQANFRPFGLGFDDSGQLYVGGVCETAPNAIVLKYSAGTYSKVFESSLTFGYHNGGAYWGTWSDVASSSPNQPMLADIVFEGKNMVMAIRNRAADLLYYAYANSHNTYGSVLKAAWNGTAYTLENNAVSAGVTGALPNHTGVPGPGGGHFYDTRDSIQQINAIGALATAPGLDIITTLTDPTTIIEGGTLQLKALTGVASTRHQIYFGQVYNDGSVPSWTAPSGYFGKFGGLGDVELLQDPAPLEIGDRVWHDSDKDGIQDADENGIPNVTIELRSSGNLIATVISASDGTYAFSNATGTDTPSQKYGLTQLQPNQLYTLHFPTTVTVASQTYQLTTPTAGSNTLIDSNAPASGEVTVAAADIPTAGANNHSFDIGYAPGACTIDIPTVTATCNDNGTPSNPSDDRFTYTITATGTSLGATYSISGDDTYPNLSYQVEQTSSNSFPIADGNLSLNLTDDTTSSCVLNNVMVAAPATCSNSLPTADLALSKTADKTQGKLGDAVRYTLTLTNNGPDTATGVQVSDQLPTGITYTSHTASQGDYNPATGMWTVGTVPNGATATLFIDVTID